MSDKAGDRGAGDSSFFALYTQQAREVIVSAQAEARAMGHAYIGAEHVLLGLLRVEGSVARKVLNDLGIVLQQARAEVRRRVDQGSVPDGTKPPRDGRLAFSPQTKAVLERTALEARKLGDDRHIGTEHLLLTLVGEGSSALEEMLNNEGAVSGTVRNEIMRQIGCGNDETDAR